MTIFTHVAFAGAIGAAFNFNNIELTMIMVGSILPDLDNPVSSIGRMFPFISKPLNKQFQHRKFIHSVLFWFGLYVFFSFFFPIITPLIIGAITHILIDCYNIKGVCLFSPFTESVAVAAPKRHRIPVSSGKEYFILLVLVLIFSGLLYVRSKGGIVEQFRSFIGSYETALKKYEKLGQNICYLKGKFRHSNGIIENKKYLIIGTEQGDGLAIYDEEKEKIFHIPENGYFLRVNLIETKDKFGFLSVYKTSVL